MMKGTKVFFILILAGLNLVGCGRSGKPVSKDPLASALDESSPQMGSAFMQQEPAPPASSSGPISKFPDLEETTKDENQKAKSDHLSVEIREFQYNRNTQTVSLRAKIENTSEVVLQGGLDQSQKVAHLLSVDKDLEAFAVCKTDRCENFIVTLYKNKNGKISHAQFQSGGDAGFGDDLDGEPVSQAPSEPSATLVPPASNTNSSDDDDAEENSVELDGGEFVAPPATFGTTQSSQAPHSPGEAIGYSSCKNGHCGRLKDGQPVPQSGPGFQRKAGTTGLWASGHLIDFLTAQFKKLSDLFPHRPNLLWGDVSLKAGGHFPGHHLHNTGLDSDLCYPTTSQSENGHCIVVYNTQSKNFDKRFDIGRFWILIKSLTAHGEVPYIFVHPAIKNLMCKFSKDPRVHEYSNNPNSPAFKALHALLPNDEHFNHFHVRVECAPWMIQCEKVNLNLLPAGTGC